MKYFDYVITDFLIWLVKLCDKIAPSHILAIILFTFFVKLILFPFSLWAQKQAIKLVKIKPQLDDVQAYFSHDWRLLLKEQKKIRKKEGYSSIITMLPLILQIPVIVGVIRGLEQLAILNKTPPNILLPLLSSFSAFLLCYTQNKCNVLAKSMRFFAKWGLAIFLTIFSFYFTLTCGIGFGIYWVAGNILACGVQLLCNLLLNPKKYVTYEILPPIKKDRALAKRQKQREREDVKRFNKTEKNLVFYSEASGFYKYFKGMIEYVLENSKIKVHYLTSDIDDQVFKIDNPKFCAYYCGGGKLITTLMKLDCGVAVFTMPDLHKYQYKRSIVNKKIEYIYAHHGFNSLTLTIRKHALDYFDTIFCYGKNYNEEIRAMEEYYKSKEKRLVNTGYDLYYRLRQAYEQKTREDNEKKTIIIAPSWQRDNILDSCIDDIMRELKDSDYNIILRPHPEFSKRFPKKMEVLKNKYANAFQDFQCDILDADIIISDWSSVAWEFSYAANKPALFINTPMKVMNPDFDKYGITPLEISLRDKIGLSVEMDEIASIKDKLIALTEIKNPRKYIEEIMYDNQRASEECGKYLIKEVKEYAQKRRGE